MWFFRHVFSIMFFILSGCTIVHSDGSITGLTTPSGAVQIRDAKTRAETAPATVNLAHHALEHGESPNFDVNGGGVSYGQPEYDYGGSPPYVVQQDLAVIEAANEAAWEAGVEETLRRQNEEIGRNRRKVDKTTRGMLKHIRGQ